MATGLLQEAQVFFIIKIAKPNELLPYQVFLITGPAIASYREASVYIEEKAGKEYGRIKISKDFPIKVCKSIVKERFLSSTDENTAFEEFFFSLEKTLFLIQEISFSTGSSIG